MLSKRLLAISDMYRDFTACVMRQK